MNISERILKRSKTLDRQVSEVLAKAKERVYVARLVAALNERLRHHGVRVKQHRVSDLGPHVAVTGYCDYDYELRRSNIVVNICYSERRLDLTTSKRELSQEIVAVLVHELTHREQQKKRPSVAFLGSKQNIEYLSLPDEIDAFANDLAYLMHMRGITINDVMLPQTNKGHDLHHLRAYQTMVPRTPTINRLYKKLYRNLVYLGSK
jgi:hypothetical protein